MLHNIADVEVTDKKVIGMILNELLAIAKDVRHRDQSSLNRIKTQWLDEVLSSREPKNRNLFFAAHP